MIIKFEKYRNDHGNDYKTDNNNEYYNTDGKIIKKNMITI